MDLEAAAKAVELGKSVVDRAVARFRDAGPDARHPDVGALLPALVAQAGLDVVDAWAESQAGAGPGPVRDYLAQLTEVDPGDEPVVLPPLVTVVARRSA